MTEWTDINLHWKINHMLLGYTKFCGNIYNTKEKSKTI
jgi:hypothetical protein